MTDRCPACPGIHRCVEPSGPECNDYSVLFIGEAPGIEEEKKGTPFIGKTGREVNEHYLPLAGMRRDGVRFTNAIRCLPPGTAGKLDPKSARDLNLLQSCSSYHLYPEIERTKPRIIVPLGSFANRAIDPEINLELHHGIPQATGWGNVFPMYHPAGGIHEPKKMLQIRTDWVRLRKYMAGTLIQPYDRFKGREDYRALETVDEVHELLWDQWGKVMACDTENMADRTPFCLTFSVTPGTGYLIRAEDQPLLDAYQEHLNMWEGHILWHNWLHDGTVVADMGLRFPRRLIRDTMVLVFHLGNLPQGLKALALRELGMTMTDFMDVVLPHSAARALHFFRTAMLEDWERPEPQLQRDKEGRWKVYKPQSFRTKLKRMFTDYAKNPGLDMFERWDNWEDSHKLVTERCGDFPYPCISHAAEDDWPKTVHYACRDADALLRLYGILTRMKTQVRRRPQESWRDAA